MTRIHQRTQPGGAPLQGAAPDDNARTSATDWREVREPLNPSPTVVPRLILAVVIVISLLTIGLFAPGLLLVAIVAGPVLLIRRVRRSR